MEQKKMKKYLDVIKDYKISYYEFLSMFVEECYETGHTMFNIKYLMEFILDCKKRGFYSTLLRDINIKSTEINGEIKEAIINLQSIGVITYEFSDEFDIYIKMPVSKNPKQSNIYLEFMKFFVSDYKEYQYIKESWNYKLK